MRDLRLALTQCCWAPMHTPLDKACPAIGLQSLLAQQAVGGARKRVPLGPGQRARWRPLRRRLPLERADPVRPGRAAATLLL
jgi:hypothetical protein